MSKVLVNYANNCGQTFSIKYVTPSGEETYTTCFDSDTWSIFEHHEVGTKFYVEGDSGYDLVYEVTDAAEQTIHLCGE